MEESKVAGWKPWLRIRALEELHDVMGAGQATSFPTYHPARLWRCKSDHTPSSDSPLYIRYGVDVPRPLNSVGHRAAGVWWFRCRTPGGLLRSDRMETSVILQVRGCIVVHAVTRPQ